MNNPKVKSTLLMVLISVASFASPKIIQEADDAFEKGYWSKSITLYKTGIKKIEEKPEKARVTFNIAYSYYKFKDYKQAVSWLNKTVKIKYAETNPEVYYLLGDAHKSMGEYEEALSQFKLYNEIVGANDKGSNAEKSCNLAIEWQKNPTRYVVKNEKLLNTKNDDASPVYKKKNHKEVLFYSYRDGSKGRNESAIVGQPMPDIYSAALDRKGKWSKPEAVGGEGINTEDAEGAATYNRKKNRIYFTRCGMDKKRSVGCQIFEAKKQGPNAFQAAMPIEIAGDTIGIGHPALSPDDKLLYFTANMEGGKGGMDIWYMTYNKKTKAWENPTNAGDKVNTPGNEMFPYVHPDGTLYFSSNGHIGVGGYDLYKATQKDGQYTNITNLKMPLNSEADDVSIVFESVAERGFITSNRAGGRGKLDIWSFSLPPLEFSFKCTVYEEGSTTIVPGAKVKFQQGDSVLTEVAVGENGVFEIDLEPNSVYSYSISSDAIHTEGDWNVKGKLKYLVGNGKPVSTVGLTESQVFEGGCFLPIIPVTGIELPNVEYVYNEAYLTEEAKKALAGLVKTLNENPTLTIELSSNTDFRGSEPYNLDLSQRRAESVVKFLIENKIDPNRMVAKGYGESQPKKITDDNLKFVPEANEKDFPVGTHLTEDYIKALNSEALVEVAHQMNRRTEFKILRTDWQPGESAASK